LTDTPWPASGTGLVGQLADRLDGVGIGLLVAGGVGGGAGAFAQHVEAADVAVVGGALDGRLDGAAQHELLAHDADGLADGGADHRLAQAAGDLLDKRRQVLLGLVVGLDDLAGQHQAPGRGVDEQAVAAAQVAGPVGRADLLGDQLVAGVVVGRAQQGLGQAHQGQAFAGAEAELLQEAFDHALLADAAAGAAHQGLGLGADGGAVFALRGWAASRSAITAASSRYLPSSRESQSVMVASLVDIIAISPPCSKVLRLFASRSPDDLR
jgi:hypothetical protein